MGNEGEGRYWEDFVVGEEWESTGRTITETDLVTWLYFTGEWHPLHADEEYARTTPFGTRLPPGLMITAIAGGIGTPRGVNDRSVAFLESIIRYKQPVFIGDTIRVRSRVIEKRPTSRPDRGIIRQLIQVLNQRDVVVQENEWVMLYLRRPTEP